MFLTQPVSYYPSTPNYGAYPCAIGPHDRCRVSPGSNYYATGSSFQFAADTQDHRQRSLAGDKTNKETTGKKNAKWDHWDKSGAAFLGPQLWDKTIPCDPNLKLEYMDLEDFFDENEIDDESLKSCFIEGGNSYSQAADSASLSSGQDHSPTAPHMPPCSPLEPKHESTPSYGGQSFHAVDYLTSPESCPESPRTPRSPPLGSDRLTQGENVNPRLMQFTDEELKRQPVIRKNRKQYVPNELKDERYWARRRKNNLAAKRSRDARRMKENQIALRAGFLEKENSTLKTELQKTRSLLESMKRRLSAYESVD